MNRDPKLRLGAGKEGVKEIKAHPFFSNISWDDIYNKKIPVDKPIMKYNNVKERIQEILDSPGGHGPSFISDWTYIED